MHINTLNANDEIVPGTCPRNTQQIRGTGYIGSAKALASMTPISFMLEQTSMWDSRIWLCGHRPEPPAHSDLPQQRLGFFAAGQGVGKPGLWMCYFQRKEKGTFLFNFEQLRKSGLLFDRQQHCASVENNGLAQVENKMKF